ncbi:2-C-methyl-D-erythritol 2,4-cyclodiphosphate synthase [Rickettsiales endosymbiont of Stachyamoeba lipophora]|uniref:2-C-methyl-D-erythritol 2,4-cyclodiphosphate synthase n=1 Tax=Rickettsiales endosymbiont of Stachyamoeba lipophora TaxID=2486578 RepID=UPI000F649DF2|nr:2-C-methyl-D-erythritol 2,4-cyclodiphosphate synthase [Rickettsiales endosymbiont of Stachyamoeba lipophora]AZL15669.1 2-C-methyl-D-erythritol 2,4-cyclodiphosphate synthase [Rickettsiales endosymbiont of Stachyamoeba lipophora]
MSKNIVLIMAAGCGTRMNSNLPKQYIKVNEKTILEHTIAKFNNIKEIEHIIIVVAPEDRYIEQLNIDSNKVTIAKVGGKERGESVKNGLEFAKNFNPINILIHDAARPFVSTNVILQLIKELAVSEGVVPVQIINQSLKKWDTEHIIENKLRENYVIMQTPQCFKFAGIYDAYQNTQYFLDDDVAIGINNNIKVKTIIGNMENIKITTTEDLGQFNYEYRVGNGFDVHQFGEGSYITLGGVEIPFSQGIIAHSDGDVILHAITDAILGSIGCGDIGVHFSPHDPQWKNASSDRFIKYALDLLTKNNAQLVNIDITMMAEQPKISTYREEILVSLSNILRLKSTRISLKATTTEKLGFLGRKEGIAALVTVMIKQLILE